ncbi:MAG: hypothetical protein AVDCRST_MAG06-895, partial [uncultured Nocardioides sp.]
ERRTTPRPAAPPRLRPPARGIAGGPHQDARPRRRRDCPGLREGARRPALGGPGAGATPPAAARRCRAQRRRPAGRHAGGRARAAHRLSGDPPDRGPADQSPLARRPDQPGAAAQV